jgi:uncharacterized protein (TIGR00251 family)
MEANLQIRETEGGVDVPLHVQPRARRDEIAGVHNGALKLRLTAPPVDDAANNSIVAFFSSLLGLPRASFQLKSGFRSRNKILHIRGITRVWFLSHLNRS